jgi:3-phenylpropionate/cinnamic acid dioxygenase small subunit
MKITRQEAEDFLYHESLLLDDHQYEEWLKLFAADGSYWIPMDENIDPELEPSILFDDMEMLEQRVYQLVNQPHYAQIPPSRTTHLISNVTVHDPGKVDEVIVRCNLAVFELREGDHLQLGLGEQRAFAGRCEYRLRQVEGLAIVLKKVVLINRDLPIINLSFIL